VGTESDDREFRTFFDEAEPRLRRSLVAMYGPERGREAVAEALAYGWEHWSEVRAYANPAGYLFRVGQSRTRPRRRPVPLVSPTTTAELWVEPGLVPALARLTKHQRVAVVLVHGYGMTMREVAELLGLRVTTIQNHLERGLTRLREALEVSDHA
jgi:RNA polymerase sigma-70 factor (ECF subfamily)